MNYSKWEEYKGLPSDQEEDFYRIFCEYVNSQQLSYQQALVHFQPGSETLADFLILLEGATDWFDYRQMPEIFEELTLYLLQMEDDELEGLGMQGGENDDDFI